LHLALILIPEGFHFAKDILYSHKSPPKDEKYDTQSNKKKIRVSATKRTIMMSMS
jgi:hypothetical protein